MSKREAKRNVLYLTMYSLKCSDLSDPMATPFYKVDCADVGQELLRLFRQEHGPKGHRKPTLGFNLEAENALTIQEAVLCDEHVQTAKDECEQAYSCTDGPRWPDGHRGSLARLYDRAETWERLVRRRLGYSELEQDPVEGGQAAQAALGGKSLQDVSATQEAKEYDAFLCHASEDKDAIVEPFAEAMEQQGLKPWFDKAEVRWGDSLVNKINHGLSRSKLVVVFVSPDFLGKKAWSDKEFNAAVSMEVNGKTVVLPLLCGVTRDQIQERYPVIADKVYREVPEYTAASKTEPSRLEPLVGELKQLIAEQG